MCHSKWIFAILEEKSRFWLTDERRLALFPARTIATVPHHRESLIHREQDLNLRRTWFRLFSMKLCSSDNHYTKEPSVLLRRLPYTNCKWIPILQYSWENTCLESLLNKNTQAQVFSCEYCKNFQNTCCDKHLLITASTNYFALHFQSREWFVLQLKEFSWVFLQHVPSIFNDLAK